MSLFARRRFVHLAAAFAALSALTPRLSAAALRPTRPGDDEFVVVNGWVLKRSDLPMTDAGHKR